MGVFARASRRTPTGSKVPTGFEVKRSKHLARKGIMADGLYTRVSIPEGYVLGEYRGLEMPLEKALEKKRARSYMFDVRKGKEVLFVIDGANKKSASFLRYINAADYYSQQNIKFVQYNKKIYAVAIKPIRAGAEIVGWYGTRTKDVISQK